MTILIEALGDPYFAGGVACMILGFGGAILALLLR